MEADSGHTSAIDGNSDMRRGFDGLAGLVQTALTTNLYSGHVFVFRGKRGR